MLEEAFFDTNVFLYAFSLAEEDEPKRAAAQEALSIHHPCLSTQVILEFVAAALRKPHLGIDEEKIDFFLEETASFTVEVLTQDHISRATVLRRRFGFSHWDSTIVAAAHASGCRFLFSEDLQDGFTLDHLIIRNPFGN